MKYILCSIPLVLCIEVLSYICLCVLAAMFVWDICETMNGKW